LDIIRVQAELKAFTQNDPAFSVLVGHKTQGRGKATERIMKLNHCHRRCSVPN
jgi:hypothetical protein